MGRGAIRTTKDGHQYQDFRYFPEDLDRDVRRYVMTPKQAQKRIKHIQWLLQKLLDPKLSDIRRCAVVNMLQRDLAHDHRRIEDLAALSKIAVGKVDPTTLRYLGPKS